MCQKLQGQPSLGQLLTSYFLILPSFHLRATSYKNVFDAYLERPRHHRDDLYHPFTLLTPAWLISLVKLMTASSKSNTSNSVAVDDNCRLLFATDMSVRLVDVNFTKLNSSIVATSSHLIRTVNAQVFRDVTAMQPQDYRTVCASEKYTGHTASVGVAEVMYMVVDVNSKYLNAATSTE